MAGYSGTPLVKKLGVKEGSRILLHDAPPGFAGELAPMPEGVSFAQDGDQPLDLILLFSRSGADLRQRFPQMASRLEQAGMLWVAWPKRASGVPTGLTESVVQRVGLDAGLVDTKVCAINDVWSGLRFVIRKKDRKP